MSVEHLSAVLHHSRATGTAKIVLLGIANHAGDGGAYPTVRTLAIYANVDRSNARKAIQRLEELGEVARHVQAGGSADLDDRDRPNLYEVLVECPEGCAGGANHKPRKGWRRLKTGEYVPVDNRGGDSAPPRDSAPPTGGDSAPQTIPITSRSQESASVTGPREGVSETLAERARLASRPCEECSAPDELTCLRRQMRLATGDRHPYTPAPHPGGATADVGADQHTAQTTDKNGDASGADARTSASGAAVDNERPAAVGDSPAEDGEKRDEGEEGGPDGR